MPDIADVNFIADKDCKVYLIDFTPDETYFIAELKAERVAHLGQIAKMELLSGTHPRELLVDPFYAELIEDYSDKLLNVDPDKVDMFYDALYDVYLDAGIAPEPTQEL